MPSDLKYPVFKLEYNMLQFIVIIIIIIIITIIITDVVVPFLYTTAMIISLVRFPCSRHIKYYLEYSAVYGFWPWKVLANLADRPAGRGKLREVAFICLELDKVNCPYGGGERRSGPNMTLSLR